MTRIVTNDKGIMWTRRVVAQDDGKGPRICISEGEKRTTRKSERFDFTRVYLMRKEIAKLAKMFPMVAP